MAKLDTRRFLTRLRSGCFRFSVMVKDGKYYNWVVDITINGPRFISLGKLIAGKKPPDDKDEGKSGSR